MKDCFSSDFLSKYEILQIIGEGSFGRVYEGRQLSLGRTVAIKCLLPARTSREEHLKRFRREANILASLRHPGIIQIFDYGIDEGMPFIVEEFLNGQTLDELLEIHGRMDTEEMVEIGCQIAEALDYAHTHSVVHRDLKPANVFVSADNKITVLDFGLAKTTDDSTAITQTGSVVGTYLYMAPEALEGEPVGKAADIYGLGVILYHGLSGKFPHEIDSPHSIMKKVLEPPTSLAEYASHLPRGLCQAIDKALIKDPTKRPSSGKAFASELRKGLRQRVAPIPKTNEKQGKPNFRHFLFIFSLFLGLFLLWKDSHQTGLKSQPSDNSFLSTIVTNRGATSLSLDVRTQRDGLFRLQVFTENQSSPIQRASSENIDGNWTKRIDNLPSQVPLKFTVSSMSEGCGTKTTSFSVTLPPVTVEESGDSLWEIAKLRPTSEVLSPVTGPPIKKDERIYLGLGMFLAALNEAGQLNWRVRLSTPIEQVLVLSNTVLALTVLGDLVCYTLDGKELWKHSYGKTLKGDIVANDKYTVLCKDRELWISLDTKTGKEHWHFKDGSLRTPWFITEDNHFIAQTKFTLNVLYWDLEKRMSLGRLPIVERTGYITTPIIEWKNGCLMGMGTGRIYGGEMDEPPEFRSIIKGVPKMFAIGSRRIVCYAVMPYSLMALDESTGRVMWRQKLDYEAERVGSVMLAAQTLLLQRDKVYLQDTEGTIYCYDINSGHTLWHFVGLSCRKFGLLSHKRGVLFCSQNRKVTLIRDFQ